jgi:AraC family transcriptional regulator of adaptative response / DNA-3-methyladenine glycosylase II
VPGAWDGFELAVRAILGQQVSVKAATTLAGRIAHRYGDPLNLPQGGNAHGLTRIFPTPQKLMRARFNDMGIVTSRIESIRRLSQAIVNGDLSFDPAQDPSEFCAALMAIRGIGPWTAQYVAMRALKNPDAFPEADLGLVKAIGYPARMTPAELLAMAENWRPWRAYAAMLLWGSLPGSGG